MATLVTCCAHSVDEPIATGGGASPGTVEGDLFADLG